MNKALTTTLATTALNEAGKAITNIVAYKQATLIAQTELVKATQSYELEMTSIKADSKHAKKQIKTQSNAFDKQSKSFEKEKKSVRRLYEQTIQKAINTQDTAEYQRLMGIANHLNAQLDNIRHDQLTSYNQLASGINGIGNNNNRRGGCVVIDADYDEIDSDDDQYTINE